ncbi:MAG: porin family protein [Devosia sp.]|uniref:outer membrane protein n=1 Tax=Devosia sp. TaxID=1871048 RepID=UPI001ACA3724|nr:outer membrane beta-barrel protein [Devosia sp.]MBN9317021.1 porin family protein [Devosia sp.]
MKAFSGAIAALLLTTSASYAADLMDEVYVPDVAAGVEDWSGFYVGGTVGGGLFSSTFSDFDENISYGSVDLSDWGFSAGGTVGMNAQFGSGVVGIEADLNWSNLGASFYDNLYDTDHERMWDWYSTVRLRAGLAVDKTLFYATAGLAAVQVNFKGDYSPENDCGDYDGYCLEELQFGLAAGVGVEYMVSDNVSVKVEGLYVGLPTTYVDDDYDDDVDAYAVSSSAAIVRAGFNFHF